MFIAIIVELQLHRGGCRKALNILIPEAGNKMKAKSLIYFFRDSFKSYKAIH